MAREEQKSTTRDEVEYPDFLFFARNNLFCDLLQYRSTKNEIYLFDIIKKSLNKRGELGYCNNAQLSTNNNAEYTLNII